jgi:hypothetical protein
LDETLAWRRDQVVDVVAEDFEPPHTNNRRTSVVIELRDDEFVAFPVATRAEQAAIVQALRGALNLPPTPAPQPQPQPPPPPPDAAVTRG